MLNEKVLFTTLKSNFDNVINYTDRKIDASLPCKKKLIKTIIVKKTEFVTVNDFFIASLDYSMGLKEDYIYEAKLDNMISTKYEFDHIQMGNNNVARLIIGNGNEQVDISILDKIKLDLIDGGDPVYDANSAAIISRNARDLTLYMYSIKTLPNELLDPDLVVKSSLTVGTRKDNSEVGEYSSTFGEYNSATGYASHAEGDHSYALGYCSHAEGCSNATGDCSHAEGYSSSATKNYSHAEGENTTASGIASHAEGCNAKASGMDSHAEGYKTHASGNYSHAQGYYAYSAGNYSHAEGYYTNTSKDCSHAEGCYTNALSAYQHVQGKYNITDTSNTYAHIVGNGTSTSSRSNAHTLDWSGNAWYQGDVFVGGTSQSNGKKLLTEDDARTICDEKISDVISDTIYDGIRLRDSVTSDVYTLKIENGVLVTSLVPSEISVDIESLTFEDGEVVDKSIFENKVSLLYPNGDSESADINDINISPETVSKDHPEINVNCTVDGKVFTKSIAITVTDFDPAIRLIDFEYTDNGNGTYTITGWKGTKNGEASTEMVIPNNSKIIL